MRKPEVDGARLGSLLNCPRYHFQPFSSGTTFVHLLSWSAYIKVRLGNQAIPAARACRHSPLSSACWTPRDSEGTERRSSGIFFKFFNFSVQMHWSCVVLELGHCPGPYESVDSWGSIRARTSYTWNPIHQSIHDQIWFADTSKRVGCQRTQGQLYAPIGHFTVLGKLI